MGHVGTIGKCRALKTRRKTVNTPDARGGVKYLTPRVWGQIFHRIFLRNDLVKYFIKYSMNPFAVYTFGERLGTSYNEYKGERLLRALPETSTKV